MPHGPTFHYIEVPGGGTDRPGTGNCLDMFEVRIRCMPGARIRCVLHKPGRTILGKSGAMGTGIFDRLAAGAAVGLRLD